MAGKMEKLLLRLIKAEMVYTKAAGIVTEVVEEMPADDEGSFEADGIIQNCDGIAEVIGIFGRIWTCKLNDIFDRRQISV